MKGIAALLLAAALGGPAPAQPAGAPIALPLPEAGRYTLALQPGQLLLRDGAGAPLRDWPLADAAGRQAGLLAVFDAPLRRSLVVVLAGVPELWEISLDPAAGPIYDGLVHDYRMGEALGRPGYLGRRRIRLDRPWHAVFFDPRVPWLVGAEAPQAAAAGVAVVLHLDIRRAVARLPLPAAAPGRSALDGMALQGSDGAWQLLLPGAGGGTTPIDSRRWLPLPSQMLPGAEAAGAPAAPS